MLMGIVGFFVLHEYSQAGFLNVIRDFGNVEVRGISAKRGCLSTLKVNFPEWLVLHFHII